MSTRIEVVQEMLPRYVLVVVFLYPYVQIYRMLCWTNIGCYRFVAQRERKKC
jgi:hypothetical protein